MLVEQRSRGGMVNSQPIQVRTTALRGPALTCIGDPFEIGLDAAMRHEPDAIVAFARGVITHFGPAAEIASALPPDTEIENCGADALITAGFVDTHVHFPQTPVIGVYGTQLLDWLETYTFPMERRFADADFGRAVAKVFLRECLRNGITTSCVYATVFPQSVDVLFEEAERLGMRMAAGKVLMDRNAPEGLRDTAQSAYDDSRALIERWHGRGRLMYAITPRFAVTSTPEQLAAAGALCREYPDVYMQTHISENRDEIDLVMRLFPDRRDYMDVYDHYGLCRPRAILAHGVHLSEDEFACAHRTGSALSHCPTSNFFLGSGCFNIARATRKERPVRVGLGTDIGGGTSFSILTTLNEAYKAAQMNRVSLSAGHAFYLATRGSARAMYIEDKVGSLAPGMEADIVVLDMKSTPLIAYRMGFVENILDALFVQMTLGDDRAVRTTYIAGEKRYDRSAPPP
jgi:guanine deaminase